MIPILCVLLTAALAVAAFVFRQEYPDVGRRLARSLLTLAVRGAPVTKRERWAEEWTAELDEIASRPDTCTGLGFACSLVVDSWARRSAALVDPTPAIGIGLVGLVDGQSPGEAVAYVAFTLTFCTVAVTKLYDRLIKRRLDPDYVWRSTPSKRRVQLELGCLAAAPVAVTVGGLLTGDIAFALTGLTSGLAGVELWVTRYWRLRVLMGVTET